MHEKDRRTYFVLDVTREDLIRLSSKMDQANLAKIKKSEPDPCHRCNKAVNVRSVDTRTSDRSGRMQAQLNNNNNLTVAPEAAD